MHFCFSIDEIKNLKKKKKYASCIEQFLDVLVETYLISFWPNTQTGCEFDCIVEQNAPHFRHFATQISACIAVLQCKINYQPQPHDEWTENCCTKFSNEFAPCTQNMINFGLRFSSSFSVWSKVLIFDHRQYDLIQKQIFTELMLISKEHFVDCFLPELYTQSFKWFQ